MFSTLRTHLALISYTVAVNCCGSQIIYRIASYRTLPSVKKLTYHKRLQRLQLTTLESRTVRGVLIEVFKIINGFEDVNYKDYFVVSNTGLRGHECKLFKGRFNTTIRKNSFSERVIDHWSNLSYDVVACTSVLQFKKRLDIFIKDRGFI